MEHPHDESKSVCTSVSHRMVHGDDIRPTGTGKHVSEQIPVGALGLFVLDISTGVFFLQRMPTSACWALYQRPFVDACLFGAWANTSDASELVDLEEIDPDILPDDQVLKSIWGASLAGPGGRGVRDQSLLSAALPTAGRGACVVFESGIPVLDQGSIVFSAWYETA